MLDKKHRFHGHASLRHVYQRGQSTRTSYMSLRYLQNDRRKNFRAAVVVSAKVDKSAVIRNRIRRRIYEQIRTQQAKITRPYDLAFVVFSNQLANMPADKLNKLVYQQLAKANVISSSDDYHHAIVESKES